MPKRGPLPHCTSPTRSHNRPGDPPMGSCPLHGLRRTETTEVAGVAVGANAVTARLSAAIRARYNPPGKAASYWQWAYLAEFILPAHVVDDVVGRRLDGWAIAKRSLERHALEVKATRSDWASEKRHPEKRERALEISNRFYVVAPAGMIEEQEAVDEGVGLIEVILSKDGRHDRTRLKVHGPWVDAGDVPLSVVCELARRAST